MGTPLYMSPEQCRAERLGTSSDIYSLGVIAYQMISGRTPFEGENLTVISGHLQFPPPPLKARKVPRKVRKVVHRALSKVPVERPPTAEIFSSQMRAYSENIITIFRRSLVIYIENFSKLIWFSLLLYFPTILLSLAMSFVNILKFNGFFSNGLTGKLSTVFPSLLKHANISAGVAAETLITGAVAWIVVQYIDAPLRSFRVSRALSALLKKWKQFAWIIPLRIVINLFIQDDLTAFSNVTVFLLSSIDNFIFWFLPCVVMMENYHGLAALKRGWRLSLKAISTVIAAIIINLVIFFITGISLTVIILNLAAFISQNFFPSVYALPWDEFTRLVSDFAVTSIKFLGAVLLPFFAVLTALIYLKTRHADSDLLKVLLDNFKDAEVLQSNWQKNARRIE